MTQLQPQHLLFMVSVIAIEVCGEIVDPVELSCDFDGDFCRWRVQNNDQKALWKIGTRVAVDLFHSVPRGVNGPDDPFAYVHNSNHGRARAILVSDAIPCQTNKGMLAFAIWKSATPPVLEVCIRQPPDASGKITCYDTIAGHLGTFWQARVTDIPASTKPFQLLFRVTTNSPIDIVAIDKVVYDTAELCVFRADSTSFLTARAETTTNTARPNTQPTSVVPIEAVTSLNVSPTKAPTSSSLDGRISTDSSCSIAQCDFELTTCDYEAYHLVPESASLRYICHPLQTFEKWWQYVPDGLCFLVATTTRDAALTQILASRRFFTHVNSDLHFYYFLPADRSVLLMVCINTLDDCIWSASQPKRGLERWWQQRLQLPSGRLQIYFIIEQSKRGTWAGLDGVRLSEVTDSNSAVPCEVYNSDDYSDDIFEPLQQDHKQGDRLVVLRRPNSNLYSDPR